MFCGSMCIAELDDVHDSGIMVMSSDAGRILIPGRSQLVGLLAIAFPRSFRIGVEL